MFRFPFSVQHSRRRGSVRVRSKHGVERRRRRDGILGRERKRRNDPARRVLRHGNDRAEPGQVSETRDRNRHLQAGDRRREVERQIKQ